jgi:hypothetical protein
MAPGLEPSDVSARSRCTADVHVTLRREPPGFPLIGKCKGLGFVEKGTPTVTNPRHKKQAAP